MRRALVTGSLLALAVVGGCAQQAPIPAPPPPAGSSQPPTPSSTPSATPSASPSASPSGGSTPTDAALLDKALLQPEQLPGWQKAEPGDVPVEARTDPAACTALYQQTVGKVASDMGATAAYTKDSVSAQEYLDLVDNGKTSLEDLEKVVGQCRSFVADESGEKTPFTTEVIQVPQLGEKSFGVRLKAGPEGSGELRYVWVAHKDVLMLLHVDGDKVDPAQVNDLATRASEQLHKTI